MSLRFRPFFALFLGILLVGGAAAHALWRMRVLAPDFKSLAEATVAETIQARVRVQGVKLGFLNRVSLTGLDIQDKNQTGPAGYHLKADSIVFKYGWFGLLTQNLAAPAAIVLEAPQLVFQEPQFPHGLFENFPVSRKLPLTRLEFEGGGVRLRVPGTQSWIVFEDMKGFVGPTGVGKMLVQFRARSTGLLEGPIAVRGEVDPVRRSYRFEITLEKLNFSESGPFPLEDLTGALLIQDGRLTLKGLRAKIHGWESHLQGGIESLTSQPRLNLFAKVGEQSPVFSLLLAADFKEEKISGEVIPAAGEVIPFEGIMRRDEKGILFESLLVNRGYQGKGRLDFDSGDYQFFFEKETQRIGVRSNIRGLDFELQTQLDHVHVLGLDLAASARIHLSPREGRFDPHRWSFRGAFETDYFILEYAPFDDFKGSFEMDSKGLHHLRAGWGKVFTLTGEAWPQDGSPHGKFDLRVDGFDLNQVKEFAAKPLPKKVGGMLEGKLRLEGDLKHPEVIGDFGIKAGWLGRLEYDRAVVHFRGFPPYLPFEDSRIFKGRTTLYLNGTMDLSLDNILHGFQIETAEKLVIWKGWQLSTSSEEGDLEIDKILGKKIPTLALKPGIANASPSVNNTEGSQEDRYVTVGPKVRF